jgi:WD40 repeat protein
MLQAGDGREVAVLRGHTDAVDAIAFTPDGKRVVTGSFDHTARVWEVATARPLLTLRGHRGAVMSVVVDPAGTTLATAGIDTSIKLWNPASGKLRVTLLGHKSWVNAVAFSAQGHELYSASSDGTVRIWDVAAHRVKTILDAETAPHVTPPEVRSLAITPDGKLLVAGLRYGWIKIWSGPGWKERCTIKGHAADVWAVVSLPAGSVLVSGDGDWDRPGQLKFWESTTGNFLGSVPTSGEVLALASSPDGRQIATGCWNRKLEVWTVPEKFVRRR